MSFKVNFNSEHGIVESIFTGNVAVDDLLSEERDCIALSVKNNANKFLCDASNAIFNMSIVHSFKLEEMYDKEKLSRTSKIAIIEPSSQDSKDFVRFYETICFNRGWNVMIFSNRQSALKWLHE
jgi:hypothetical protein